MMVLGPPACQPSLGPNQGAQEYTAVFALLPFAQFVDQRSGFAPELHPVYHPSLRSALIIIRPGVLIPCRPLVAAKGKTGRPEDVLQCTPWEVSQDLAQAT